MQKNVLPDEPGRPDDIAQRIAGRTLAARGADYSAEVRRLLDSGREVMRRNGTSGPARVADIVAEAELSNDAFYRHFASKDALVAAILEDGTVRLQSYLAHQMAKEPDPAAQVRRWVDGVLSQARDPEVAASTLAVLWNAGPVDPRSSPSATLAPLLHAPLAALGSTNPELDASLAAHATIGAMTDHLWHGTRPTAPQADHLTQFLLAAIAAPEVTPSKRRR